LDRRLQAFAGARGRVRLRVEAQKNASPSRFRDVSDGRKARALGVQNRFVHQGFRAPCDFSLGGRRVGLFEDGRNRLRPEARAGMNVGEL
jgi:hypothetical protein